MHAEPSQRAARPPALGRALRSRAETRAEAIAGLPSPLPYPAELPITSRKDELVAALREHQAVIVAGETGSGKSPQLPKICLEAGRGRAGIRRPEVRLPFLPLALGLLGGRQGELSSGQFRRLCQRELISYQRAREWHDVHAELSSICRSELHLRTGPRVVGVPPRRDLVHQALLAGLVTHVGLREGERRDFLAPRGARFALWPASVLAKRPPRWVMVAELAETGRLWGRVAAPVKPRWVEHAAAHLIEWSYGEPYWDAIAAGRPGMLAGSPVLWGAANGEVDGLARRGVASAARIISQLHHLQRRWRPSKDVPSWRPRWQTPAATWPLSGRPALRAALASQA
jgi:HrpA-like RNA helicase